MYLLCALVLLASRAMGLVLFFDDYANCLLVGNAVRPFTDDRKISREKRRPRLRHQPVDQPVGGRGPARRGAVAARQARG